MNFNELMVRDRIDRIMEWGKHLDDLAALPDDDFMKPRNLAAAESFLRRSLEAIFDVGRHLLARIGRIDLAQEYKAIARGLAQERIVRDDVGVTLVRMAGYRNRLVHFYHEVTTEELHDIVVNHRQDLLACACQILEYISRNPSLDG